MTKPTSKNSSVQSLRIICITRVAFGGTFFKVKRSVNTMIYRVLIRPHRYCSNPARKKLIKMFDPIKSFRAVSVLTIISWIICISYSLYGELTVRLACRPFVFPLFIACICFGENPDSAKILDRSST